jgi:predicted  nucleic acid-binding Zn ribbon protein
MGMARSDFELAARRWLLSHLNGDDRCPRCRDDQWRISDPTYPIIQFTCQHCGYAARTSMDNIES